MMSMIGACHGSGLATAVALVVPVFLGGCGTDPETEVFEDALEDTTTGMETTGGDTLGEGTFGDAGLDRDLGAEPTECEVGQNDCPPEQKCTAVFGEEAELGSENIGYECVPVLGDDLPGQACEVLDQRSGRDSCVEGSFCLSDSDGDNAKCASYCVGGDAQCGEDEHCVVRGSNDFALCLPSCNPLAVDCADPWVCTEDPGEARWFCQPRLEGQQGGYGSACVPLENALCPPGFACVESIAVDAQECLDQPNAVGCCGQLCDTSNPEATPCPSPREMCLPLYEDGGVDPELENVGVCAVPIGGG